MTKSQVVIDFIVGRKAKSFNISEMDSLYMKFKLCNSNAKINCVE